MARIAFLTFYNDYSVAVNLLSGITAHAGHDVSAIFFKLPRVGAIARFNDIQRSGDGVNPSGDIYGSSIDVNPWTEQEVELLNDVIAKLLPDILAVSCRSTDRAVVQDVLPGIRQRHAMTVIAGGYGPSLDPDFFSHFADYVYVGEAEHSFVQLINRLEQGADLNDFDNIAYRRNGSLIRNSLSLPKGSDFRLRPVSVDTCHIDNDQVVWYGDPNSIVASYKYSTFVGRGCVSTCSYCSAGQWYKIYREAGINIPKRRNRRVEEVMEELSEARRKDYTFIFFRDSFLTGTTEYLSEFFERYEQQIAIPFWAQFLPMQFVDNPRLLEKAVDAGFVATEVGFQSGSDRINREIFNRFIAHDHTLKYVALLAEYEINMKYDFIIGNPAETEEDIADTIRLIQQLPRKKAYLELPRLIYLAGTPIAQRLEPYHDKQQSHDYYYRAALIYLCAFVMTRDEFEQLSLDKQVISSHSTLREVYKKYLADHDIKFVPGTHDIPESITMHRYKRILQRKGYDEIIIWGQGEYYRRMAHVFTGLKSVHLIEPDSREGTGSGAIHRPEYISDLSDELPVFICLPDKQKALLEFRSRYRGHKGMVYV